MKKLLLLSLAIVFSFAGYGQISQTTKLVAGTNISLNQAGNTYTVNATVSTSGEWHILGNSGTTAGTNFLGTTDAQDLVFKRNSSEAFRVYSSGNIIGIGTATPAASSLVDVTSTTKGFLVPRMTTVQKNAISSPATGLIVFDTDLLYFYFYDGVSWVAITKGINQFTQNGNSFGATAVLGTDDNFDLNFETNSTTKMVIEAGGDVGIGTNAPDCGLEVAKDYVSALAPTIHMTSNVAGISFETTGGNANERNWAILNSINTNGTLEFLVSPANGSASVPATTVLQMDRTGNVAVGTGSPGNANKFYAGSLNISGNFYTTAAPTNGAIIEGSTSIGLATNSAKLHVKGSTSDASADAGLLVNSADAAIASFQNDKKVGIGDSDPEAVLEVAYENDTPFLFNFRNGAYTSNANGFKGYQEATGKFYIYNGGYNFFTINTAGNATFESNNVTEALNVRGDDNVNSSYNFYAHGSSNNLGLLVSNSGNVKMGDATSAPLAALHIANTVTTQPTFVASQITSGSNSFVVTYDGRIYGTALHNNSGSVAGTSNQYVASATYTFAATDSANTSANTTYEAQYIRVGNVVTVSGVIDIDPDVTLTTTILKFLPPIPSNFTATSDCRGTANSENIAGQSASILCTTTYGVADYVLMKWEAVNTTNQPMSYTYTYEVK